jgi:hypothetical protein
LEHGTRRIGKMPDSQGDCSMNAKDARLKALEEKQAQIRAQIQAIKARDSVQERKDETRKKIILGALVLPSFDASSGLVSLNPTRLADVLKNDRDRALFGLPPLAKPEPAQVATQPQQPGGASLFPTGNAWGAVSSGGE